MVNSAEFAKRLHKIIDFYGISATSFSEKIGFNRSTISHIFSGRNKPSLEFVMKVVATFPEVELYWLLNGKGSFPSTNNSQDINTPRAISEEKNIRESTSCEEKKETVHSLLPNSNDTTVDKIVIFYTDGTFKAYEN